MNNIAEIISINEATIVVNNNDDAVVASEYTCIY